ncbi:nucleoside triphosphate pyrophosphatase [Acidocella sp.]|uniref:Maf family protein n=1 Tax=Acidocella sp. TaxID=50710 RepID=UPI0026201D59|nr:nucleoside triphosphate pyrophosphatase [Acidocella sp.]
MLILASTSRTRQDMLRAAGLGFTALPSGVDEAALKADFAGPPAELAQALARAKACPVARAHPAALTLGADQLLVQEGRIFDKPATLAEAAAQLRVFSGCSHQLVTAACLYRGDELVWSGTEVAVLHVRPLSEAFIARYLAAEREAVLASVGAYRLEGLGAQLFSRIEGDHFTILGLPLLPVLAALRALGALAP